jgi:hypothetical protein
VLRMIGSVRSRCVWGGTTQVSVECLDCALRHASMSSSCTDELHLMLSLLARLC